MKTLEQQTKWAAGIVFSLGIVVIALSLSSCGPMGPQGATGASGTQGAQGAAGPQAAASTPTAIQTIVNAYNANLAAVDGFNGNDVTQITPGLKCTLYTVPNLLSNMCLSVSSNPTTCNAIAISSSSGYASVASWEYSGTINQPDQAGSLGFNLLPTALQSSYSTNFEVTCTGYFVNTDYNYHQFDVASDDGSLLYLNGSLIVQNDGEHASQDVKSAQKALVPQVYSIQLNYFQGPGNVELIVNEDGALLPAANLYH